MSGKAFSVHLAAASLMLVKGLGKALKLEVILFRLQLVSAKGMTTVTGTLAKLFYMETEMRRDQEPGCVFSGSTHCLLAMI